MSSSQQQDSTEQADRAKQIYDRTSRLVRRIGYAVLFGGALLIAVPMVVSAIQGIQADRVWDPFTGTPVPADETELDCLAEAADLAYLAGEHGEHDSRWEQRYRRWRLRCEAENPEFRKMLGQVREQLRGDEDPPILEDADENRAD